MSADGQSMTWHLLLYSFTMLIFSSLLAGVAFGPLVSCQLNDAIRTKDFRSSIHPAVVPRQQTATNATNTAGCTQAVGIIPKRFTHQMPDIPHSALSSMPPLDLSISTIQTMTTLQSGMPNSKRSVQLVELSLPMPPRCPPSCKCSPITGVASQ